MRGLKSGFHLGKRDLGSLRKSNGNILGTSYITDSEAEHEERKALWVDGEW